MDVTYAGKPYTLTDQCPVVFVEGDAYLCKTLGRDEWATVEVSGNIRKSHGDARVHGDGTCSIAREAPYTYNPIPGAREHYLQGLEPKTAPPTNLYGDNDDRKTSTTGSARMVLDRQAGLTRCFSTELFAFLAATTWLQYECNRPYVYYQPDGSLIPLEPGLVISQHGVSSLWDGKPDKYDRPHANRYGSSDTDWWAFDHGHLEAHRLAWFFLLTGATEFLLLATMLIRAAATHPWMRPASPPDVLKYNDAQRWYGWSLSATTDVWLAHRLAQTHKWDKACPLARQAPDLSAIAKKVVASAALSMEPWGDGYFHGGLFTLSGCGVDKGDAMGPQSGRAERLYEYAGGWIPEDVCADASYGGIWSYQQRLWQMAVFLDAIAKATEVGLLRNTRDWLVRGAFELAGTARQPMWNADTGIIEKPDLMWRCFSPKIPGGAARPAKQEWVFEWYVSPLCRLARMFPGVGWRKDLVSLALDCEAKAGSAVKFGGRDGSTYGLRHFA